MRVGCVHSKPESTSLFFFMFQVAEREEGTTVDGGGVRVAGNDDGEESATRLDCLREDGGDEGGIGCR